ncbi:MAG: heat shock protein transcriptional repressor HspR [Terriglobales bacterium]
MRKRGHGAYMISAVAEQFGVHPQTLRLYEREGLLKPSRTEGNTRLYTDEDLKRLEMILALTRDMGVNLAGVEVVLDLRQKIEEMQERMRQREEAMREQMQSFLEYLQREMLDRAPQTVRSTEALIPLRRTPPRR